MNQTIHHNMAQALVQDDKILLRISSTLSAAINQVMKEELPSLNRSEFIRRAIRFTIDNVEQFKTSESATIHEAQNVETVERINIVRGLFEDLTKYTEALQVDPSVPINVRQLAYLNRIVGQMIFSMNE